jgi:hypothetical protein
LAAASRYEFCVDDRLGAVDAYGKTEIAGVRIERQDPDRTAVFFRELGGHTDAGKAEEGAFVAHDRLQFATLSEHFACRLVARDLRD